jgi:DNA repair protein RadC
MGAVGGVLDAFKTNGSSPPTVRARRYRLKLATWTVVREPGTPSPRTLNDPAAVAALARDFARAADDDKEHFWCVLLNAQNRYLLHTEVSVGTQSATLVHPREVFGPALREGAAAVILVHCHPSGDPTPSHEDIRLTRQLVECSRVFDVPIHDHVVVGNGTERYVSMAERGLL